MWRLEADDNQYICISLFRIHKKIGLVYRTHEVEILDIAREIQRRSKSCEAEDTTMQPAVEADAGVTVQIKNGSPVLELSKKTNTDGL